MNLTIRRRGAINNSIIAIFDASDPVALHRMLSSLLSENPDGCLLVSYTRGMDQQEMELQAAEEIARREIKKSPLNKIRPGGV